MSNNRRLVPFRGDRSLWIIISAMLVISLLVIYSSTVSMAHKDVAGDTSYYMLRQAKFIVFSFIAMFFIHWIDFRSYAKFTRTIFYISVILVIASMFVGESRNDAARWIPVPFFGRFQPSEMLKVSLMALLAVQLGKRADVISNIPILPALTPKGWKRNPQKNRDILNKTTKPLVMPVAIACIAIFPMNLSTAMMIFLVSMMVLVVARVRIKEILKLVAVGAITLTVVVSTMLVFKVGRAETWMNRIENYVAPLMGREKEKSEKDQAENFQKIQAQIAIASGGVIGKGPGNSTQRSQLPHPYSDFAYAFIIEEYGIAGGVVIFLLFLWVFYRAGVIMQRCRNATTVLLVLGLSLSITVQAFVNMLVCVGIFPVTGQPLPLISMGGSSVLFTCIAFGMILSVSRQNDAEALAEAKLLSEATDAGNGETTVIGATKSQEDTPEITSDYADYYDSEDGSDDYDSEEYDDTDEYDEEGGEDDGGYEYDDNDEDDDYEEVIEEKVQPKIVNTINNSRNSYKGNNQTTESDDDFPFVVVDKSDPTKVTDSKTSKDVVDLYD